MRDDARLGGQSEIIRPMDNQRRLFPGLFLIAIGVVFLLRNAGLIRGRLGMYLLSMALILWGLSKLTRRSG